MKIHLYLRFVPFLFALILFCFFTGCSSSNDDPPTDIVVEEPESNDPEPIDPNRPWNLVWEEEFESNLSAWNIWESGAFNNEIQYYRPEQLVLENGILSINVQRETIIGANNPFDSTDKEFEYVSGRIETKATYGPSGGDGETEYRFMASIKFPPGNGMWPAFWSYGDPWPTKGEIDIIEARGNLPMEFSSNIFYGTEPNIPLTNNDNTVVEHELEVDITADFHTYELIWTSNSLEIIFDDESLHKYNANGLNFITSLFNQKQQIVLNTAVGGFFFPGTSSSSYVDTSQMQVDWVRVYKR
ncbi:glycoside hydrolase family 16 protein [Croceitalea rosinachiae]|uniref:Glycoside hydrolase family 16 protein n=1 Tax=Croceitalea rosinachiae TaxID=3075596 RepID=A0ABU3AA97_9FLAO|nr:glycoside hydrolase family 16 protein [Croceitalea sp. F388]MDT0605983.1 glycoside hydrolase family 16 protein [Croceitalea sp. F388]